MREQMRKRNGPLETSATQSTRSQNMLHKVVFMGAVSWMASGVLPGCSGDPAESPTPEVTPTATVYPPTATPVVTPTEVPETPTATAAPTPTDVPPTDTPIPTPTATPEPTPTATPEPVEDVLRRPSKSGTIDLSSDESLVAMVNPEDDSISVFTTVDDDLLARVETGDEPSAIVFHPDGVTAFVANRGDATIVKVRDMDLPLPDVGIPQPVGSEPTGLALSPTGALLFVAEFAEGRVSVWDTRTMTEVAAITAPNNPRAVAVTNDGDTDDDDELLVVPEFFGEAALGGEGKDDGRTGRVRIYTLSDLNPSTAITFAPLDSGFVPDGTTGGTVKTSPNQLWNVAIQGDKIYVPSVSASPQAPVKFNTNVQPVVYVGSLTDRAEVLSNVGTTNLARKVADALASGTTRYFLADIVDLSFKGTSNIAYVVSRGADVVQRVVYDTTAGVTIGSDINTQINIGSGAQDGSAACQTPTGIISAIDAPRAYVNCWVNRRLGVVDLANQVLSTTVEAAPAPSGLEESEKLGRRFFFTARGRWSKESWSGCGSCHPDGLTDNVTWTFAAGPRQTTSMDGSYSHGALGQKRRVFNWTGIFDEIHDFEANVRGTSGGLGALTTSSSNECGDITKEQAVTLPANLEKSTKEVQDTTPTCVKDWDDVDNYLKVIRPPKGLQFLDADSVARGRKLFGEASGNDNNGGCVKCHGGAGWTLSRVFWTPKETTNTTLKATPLVEPTVWASTWNYNTLQIQRQPVIASDATGPAEAAEIAPLQVSCVLRNIGTFGIPGDSLGTDALEKKGDGTRAQGRGGYNIPSLYGLSVGAPYLHHGQAQTLQQLFDDSKWSKHLNAGNAVFLTSGDVAQQKADLINFILSIDADTEEFSVPTGHDGCPTTF